MDQIRDVLDSLGFDYTNFLTNLTDEEYKSLQSRTKTKKKCSELDRDFFFDTKKFFNFLSTEFDPNKSGFSDNNRFAIAACRLFAEFQDLILMDRFFEGIPSMKQLESIAQMMEGLLEKKTIIATITQEFFESLPKEDRIVKFFGRKVAFKNGIVISDSLSKSSESTCA